MGQRYKNDDIRTAISDNTKLDGYSDKVPSELSKDVQLVVDVTPNHNRFSNVIITSSTTLRADMDFYVTSVFGTAWGIGASNGTLTIAVNLIATNLLNLHAEPGLLNDAVLTSVSLPFYYPIKLDRGSGITITANNGFATLTGYYVDTQIYDTGININPAPLIKP